MVLHDLLTLWRPAHAGAFLAQSLKQYYPSALHYHSHLAIYNT